MSLPPTGGAEYDSDMGVKFGSGPSDGVYYKIILDADRTVWRYLMLKKDLYLVYLRWFLLLQDFDFEVMTRVGHEQ